MTVTQWVDKIYPRIKQYQIQNEYDRCYDDVVDNNLCIYNHIDRINNTITNNNIYTTHFTNDEKEDMSLTTDHLHSLAHHLYECELNPNEVLYFPSLWMHATLNMEEYNVFMSVFIDTQLIK